MSSYSWGVDHSTLWAEYAVYDDEGVVEIAARLVPGRDHHSWLVIQDSAMTYEFFLN